MHNIQSLQLIPCLAPFTTVFWTGSCEVGHGSRRGILELILSSSHCAILQRHSARTYHQPFLSRLALILRSMLIALTRESDVEVIDSSLNGALRTVLIYVSSLIAAIVRICLL